ncbi:DHH family phosphoesterase [Halovivax gelatinilyticus]|uniref:DHH family phosphoesterase n=1 Tax=Halovivax gelatinilyticus TaxID=2961597 RepID=UPI0020CA62C8|nr:DHH family phosphoesterase [Halovivax gelatinilyticus]
MVARFTGGTIGDPSVQWVLLVEIGYDFVHALDPLVLSAGILAFVLLATGGWWLYRWVNRPPGTQLKRVLSAHDEVTVLMHPNPDPDAMACAMGIAALAESVETDAILQYPGQIRHQENRAFRTVLELDLEKIESSAELATDAIVLVDHNTARGFTGSQDVEPIAVVDHHPGNGAGTQFTDVRPEYGAAATIVAEYFQEIGARLETEIEDDDRNGGPIVSKELATGLLYGIQSDTNQLTKGCTPAEFAAAAFLFDGIDEAELDRIANPQVADEVLQTKADAIRNKRVNGSFAICDVGEIENVDAIPQAADELMHLEGVTAVVVFGESKGTLHLSGRSRDDRVHMGETLRHVVSDIPMASAGGHARMGGGQLSIEHMNGLGPSDGVSKDEFESRLFAALAGER